jgi:hypothetical protein
VKKLGDNGTALPPKQMLASWSKGGTNGTTTIASPFVRILNSVWRLIRSVSEIEFCTLYVVAERWTLGCMLRFVRANNDFSDTVHLSL